jgi:hypothetical protein
LPINHFQKARWNEAADLLCQWMIVTECKLLDHRERYQVKRSAISIAPEDMVPGVEEERLAVVRTFAHRKHTGCLVPINVEQALVFLYDFIILSLFNGSAGRREMLQLS